jgi:AraC family transcriptional regulator of adaptative response / DNA-3-methyladenine glycosylase II
VELIDVDVAYRALSSRDSRFDGRLWFGVTTTGIYCRPVCPAQTPLQHNVRLFASPAAAVGAGFRACRRCRPDSAPGSRAWDHRSDLTARALRLITAGSADEDGIAGLARALAVSERHLHRTLVDELGATPSAFAGSRRAQTARLLLDETDLAVTEVAYAAGFASIRAFNDAIRREFGATPSQLRAGRKSQPVLAAAKPTIAFRLRIRPPYDAAAVASFVAARSIAGVERVEGLSMTRAVRLPHGIALATVDLPKSNGPTVLRALDADLRDLGVLVTLVRRWLDLDADPALINNVIAADPAVALLVSRRPGLRVPTTVDPWETLLRAVVGQQVSVAAARTLLGRLVGRFGAGGAAELRPFPAAKALAGLELSELAGSGLTTARAATVLDLARRVADGRLDLAAPPAQVKIELLAVRGVGPWTADYFALRGLGDPDAFPFTDLVLRRALAGIGVSASAAVDRSRLWRPWRAYVAQHLWTNEGEK